MLSCPLCSAPFNGLRGLAAHFRNQSDTHPDYKTWQADQKWAGKTEPEDYVSCRECGLRAGALVGHIKAKHGINADQYRITHPGARLRSDGSRAKRNAALKQARSSPAFEGTKTLPCPECDQPHEINKFVGSSHDLRCPACKRAAEEACKAEEDARFAALSEPKDFVTCVECGYRAENLTSHIQNAHPTYRKDHPEVLVVALNSKVRDKSALQGVPLSTETRRKMSENAGRWNAGLTKGTHPSVAAQAEAMKGKPSWSKGLTAAHDSRLQATVAKLKLYVGENRPWHNGLRADLTLEDFAPVLDDEGRLDRQRASEILGFSWNTISKYMESYGLELSDVNVKARHEAQTIRLTEEDLKPYRLKNGKLVVAWAASRLGRGTGVVAREADRLGLPRFKWGLSQGLCMGSVAEALGGQNWLSEWRDTLFRNPKTGRRYKFDGYFKSHGLIVEYHGYQHFIYPNAFLKTEEEFFALRERDRHKAELIRGAPGLTYFLVRYDQPFDDLMYMRGRLEGAGVLLGGASTLEMFSGTY